MPSGDWIVERYSSTAAHEIARVSATGAMTDISRTGDHLARPGMRFTPAKMGPKAVPQLVEQPFNFRILKQDTLTATPKKPPV